MYVMLLFAVNEAATENFNLMKLRSLLDRLWMWEISVHAEWSRFVTLLKRRPLPSGRFRLATEKLQNFMKFSSKIARRKLERRRKELPASSTLVCAHYVSLKKSWDATSHMRSLISRDANVLQHQLWSSWPYIKLETETEWTLNDLSRVGRKSGRFVINGSGSGRASVRSRESVGDRVFLDRGSSDRHIICIH